MSDEVSIVWSDDYLSYDFGPHHPLKPVRLKMTVELARHCGIFDASNVTVVAPRLAARPELETVHDPSYVGAVEAISNDFHGPFEEYGWGIGTQASGNTDNPAFPGMFEAASLVAGGSLAAAERINQGEAVHAFNIGGGATHHAQRAKAWGFGIFNDCAVAIRWLLDHGVARVAYVDVDVHHGDGVQAAFYDEPRVLTISMHESGNFLFPGTGFPEETGNGDAAGTKVNLSLPPHTYDDVYMRAFERIVPPLVEAFAPEVLVTQLGCDSHALDPLAHLALTTRTYSWLATMLHELAHRVCAGRWLAVGGGGYQVFSVVPRAWTIYVAEMARVTLPDVIPSAWLDLARGHGATHLFETFTDPEVDIPESKREELKERVESATQETKRAVFGVFGLR